MNKTLSVILIATVFTLLPAGAILAQDQPDGFKEEFSGYFDYSANRITALAEMMPESAYTWSPGEGVMSVARVYMHIARYNFYYLESSLGIPVPGGIDPETMEEITDKAKVTELLQRSVDHVKEAVKKMPDGRLSEPAELYGRTVDGWAVLFQLINHMNEHLGQSIAYARMNDVVPPWSE